MGIFNFGKNKQQTSNKQEEVKKDNQIAKEGQIGESFTNKVNNNNTLQDNGFPKKDEFKDSINSTESTITDIKDNDQTTKDFNNNKGKSKKPLISYITVKKGDQENTISIKVKGDNFISSLIIEQHEFTFRKDASHIDTPYRIIGYGSSLLVNVDELDYIYTRFKNIK